MYKRVNQAQEVAWNGNMDTRGSLGSDGVQRCRTRFLLARRLRQFTVDRQLRHNEVIWLLKATSPRITVDKVPEKAMVHRCLLIPELFGSVCEFLRHDYKMWRPLQWSATLASLARTCRAFEGPALGVLWRDIEGLRPLLCTMPSTCLS